MKNMQIKLYNTLTKDIENFKPFDKDIVKMYSCGPTVYSFAHIGNLRAFLFADFLYRVLKNVGEFKIRRVMNITDIDDKTIRDSQIGSSAWLAEFGEQTTDALDNLKKLTAYYTNEFLKDLAILRIDSNDFYSIPKATDYIQQMQELVRKISANGFAYESKGSVYFDVSKWKEVDKYGKLKNIDFDNFIKGNRIDSDEYEREQVSDFVIWKAKKEGEPFWDFDFNSTNLPGRPGWHLECSAMEHDILGLPFDIHTGGVDLQFPHHEDEIAQSKAGYGVEPTAYWCHNEFLEVEGKKMSKSLGNFYTLKDLIAKGIDPLNIRFAMLSAHYRSKYNFTFEDLEAAKKGRNRIQDFIYDLFAEQDGNRDYDATLLKNEFDKELANDLHSPKALAVIFKFINNNEAGEFSKTAKTNLIEFFIHLNSILAVFEIVAKNILVIPEEIKALAEARLAAKTEKNWQEADRFREQIAQLGYTLKDTKDGYLIEKC